MRRCAHILYLLLTDFQMDGAGDEALKAGLDTECMHLKTDVGRGVDEDLGLVVDDNISHSIIMCKSQQGITGETRGPGGRGTC